MPIVIYSSNDNDDFIGGYEQKNKVFVFNSRWIKNIVTNPDFNRIGIQDNNLELFIPIYDYMEILGVEEAAHYILDTEKPDYFNKFILNSELSGVEYESQDHESRELLWQLSYVKRYYPQYYPNYKKYYDKVIEYRKRNK